MTGTAVQFFKFGGLLKELRQLYLPQPRGV